MTNAKYYAGPIPADRIAEEYHEEYCKSGAPFKLPEEDLCFEVSGDPHAFMIDLVAWN